MARSTSLSGLCPDPLVIQLDWQPIELNLENVILEEVTYAESKFVVVEIIIFDDGLTVERGLLPVACCGE